MSVGVIGHNSPRKFLAYVFYKNLISGIILTICRKSLWYSILYAVYLYTTTTLANILPSITFIFTRPPSHRVLHGQHWLWSHNFHVFTCSCQVFLGLPWTWHSWNGQLSTTRLYDPRPSCSYKPSHILCLSSTWPNHLNTLYIMLQNLNHLNRKQCQSSPWLDCRNFILIIWLTAHNHLNIIFSYRSNLCLL